MKRIGFHVVCLVLFPASVLSASGQASRSAPESVAVKYLANEVYAPDKGYVVIRSAFEINGPPHRWVALDMEFRLSQAVPLIKPDDKVFMKRWNNLFLPEAPRPARWTDCRLDVDYRELEKAKNLPKGKTFVLWTMGLIYDHAIGKYVGSGWAVRAPLLVTTDASGRILQADAITLPPIRYSQPSEKTIDALRLEIRVKHLKPLPRLEAYRATRRDGTFVTVLTESKGQLWQPASFGGAFGPIDSAGKAEELVRLMHPGGVMIHTPEQYDAVLTAARKLGFPPAALPKDAPEFPGLRITPVEGLGWRVDAMILEPRKGQLGDMAAWEYVISAEDGRVSANRTPLLRGPGGKMKSPVPEDVYTTIVLSHLAGLSPDIITPRLVPTADITKLPVPADVPAGDFVTPVIPAPEPEPPATQPAPKPEPVRITKPKPLPAPEPHPAPSLRPPDPTKLSEQIPATRPAERPAKPKPDHAAKADVITTPGPMPIHKSE